MVWVAKKPKCGCIVGAAAEDMSRKELARWLGEWLLDGLQVVRVEAKTVRVALGGCEHDTPLLAAMKGRRGDEHP